MAFGLLTLGLKEVVTDVGTGDIEVCTNLLQHARACEKILTNRVVALLNLAQRLNAVEPRKAHQEQQSAETDQENDAARKSSNANSRGSCSIGLPGKSHGRRFLMPWYRAHVSPAIPL